ncbi:MAG: MFS transporter [Gemmatimonadaceae bacterium]
MPTTVTAKQGRLKKPSLLDRVGLNRPDLRAWAMYDWAVSSLQTTIMVAVFPIFFVRVAAANLPESQATQAYAAANTVAALIVAFLSPLLGAVSDFAGKKKVLLTLSMIVGALATAGMFFIQRGDLGLASTLFVIAIIGGTASVVFYESLLPHIASPEEIDRVSTAGYAVGYIGGGVLLALNLAWIQNPEWFGLPTGPDLSADELTLPSRLAFLSVAVWWCLFSIPLLRRVREPARKLEADEVSHPRSILAPFSRLGETLRELRGFKHAFLMLLAFLVYNDGIQTIIKMATAYGTEIGIGQSALIAAILVVQFVGIPFTFLFGALAGRIGAKRSVFIGLLAYTCISIVGYFMRTTVHFVILAGLTGMVQGGTQALSRSLFATLIPAHKSGEFFGFYSVFEKFANVFGPLVFAATIAVTGSSRNAILSVILFFAIGAWLLSKVDVEKGRAAARAAENQLTTV